ncbi:calcium-binding protein [Kineosporia babensis]|uniref:Calcium-binding protein n=1 Tax=Kineosporia babensis TaxID=499548 RepID=A0A9X1NDN4_9ACTN|nr:calcium-binding protein [Kineosporia babensis]MCD5313247.1 hypothetical protein [Kineosporia babensis]
MALRRNRLTVLMGTASLLGVGVGPLLLVSPAHAAEGKGKAEVIGTAEAEFFTFSYDGGTGVRSDADVRVDESGDESSFVYTVDDVIEIEVGSNCTHPDEADLTKVVCTIDKTETGGNDPAGVVSLNDGNDILRFTNLTNTSFTSIDLGAGADTYTATRPNALDAAISGGDGVDTINAGTGAYVAAGAGNDLVTLIGGAAEVHGEDGNDLINGGVGDDSLHGEAGDDVIYGNDGDDYIVGGAGNDELYGGKHNDTIYGNTGNDTIYGNSGDDYISGGAGVDTISGGAGNNTIVDV